VDIEKLLNRKFPREQAVIPSGYQKPFKAAPMRAHKPAAAAEDWFSKPYEPSTSTVKPVEQQVTAPVASKPQRQVAALFRAKT